MTIGSKVPSSGPSNAKIMVVGEAPGRNEEVARRPFVGAAGELLRRTMLSAGIDESQVYFANLSKYRPPDNELKAWYDRKSGIPNNPKLLEGLLELKEEIASVNPTVIIALGNYPLKELTRKTRWSRTNGASGIGDWRGSIIEGVGAIASGRKVVAANHPAAVLRKYSLLPTLTLDLIRAREQSAFPDIRRPQKRIVLDPQGDEREMVRRRLLDHGSYITFDIEMVGSNLLCVGFTSDKDESYVIRTKTGSDIRFVKDLLESGKPLCAQNAMFDVSMLEYWMSMRIMQNIKHDTMLASHAAYIELPKDLGYLCSIYTEQPCYWTNVDWKGLKKKLDVGDTSAVDSIDFLTYNAIDAWVTHDVMEQQQKDELLDKNVKATFDFEMSLLTPLWKMARKGIMVDSARMRAIEESCRVAIKEKGGRLEAIAGHPINIGSNAQVTKFLYSELALPPKRFTKADKPSADDFALADLDLTLPEGEKKEAVNLIRGIRKNTSLISKFTTIEYDKDGRMRCHYNPGGTTTGRLSSKKFFPTGTGANLQNIPRDKEVRKVFVPDKGKVFFYNDLERAESLVVAKLTGDPTMLAHHAPGTDAHRALASLLFNKPEEEITEEERYMGKQTRHAGNYMEGPLVFMRNVNKIAASTGVSINAKQAKYFIGMYRELHPYLTRWWTATGNEVRIKRILHNLAPHRRPRYFYDRVDQCLPTAIAYRPQSTVGDVLNIGLLAADTDPLLQELGVELLIQVHDAIGGQVPEANVQAAMARMAELMNIPIEVPSTGEIFTIPVEITIGPSWGECKKIKVAA